MVDASKALYEARDILRQGNIEDSIYEVRLLYHFVTGQDSRLCACDAKISKLDADKLQTLAQKRASHYPLQYILGKWDFMTLTLKIGEGVLIPRADTEIVCEAAANACSGLDLPVILDLCAGSGALALGVKSLVPSADISAVELSDKALDYLHINADNSINIVKADIFGYEKQLNRHSADIIMSNPPYISLAEYETLAPELSYEPRMALTDDADGLRFYRYIAKEYKSILKDDGYLIFEIGYNEELSVTEILKENGYTDINVIQDYGGNPRAVISKTNLQCER
ncbi:MAG: peptide chain release factor N(5)-glutamine methyltransferase [Oscillospiraceae bacterium]